MIPEHQDDPWTSRWSLNTKVIPEHQVVIPLPQRTSCCHTTATKMIPEHQDDTWTSSCHTTTHTTTTKMCPENTKLSTTAHTHTHTTTTKMCPEKTKLSYHFPHPHHYHKVVPWEHQVVIPLPTPTPLPQRCALRTPSCHTTAHTHTTTTKMCPENTKLSHHCPHPHHKDVPWEHQVVIPLPTPLPQRCALRTSSCHTTAHTPTTKMCPENTKLSYHCPHPHHYHKDVPWEHQVVTPLPTPTPQRCALRTPSCHTTAHTHTTKMCPENTKLSYHCPHPHHYHKDVPWEHQVVTPLPTPTPQRCALRTPSCHTTAHTPTTKMCPENIKLSHHCPHPYHKDVPWEHQVVIPLPTPTPLPQRCALRTPSCHTTAHTHTTKMCPENIKLSYHCPHHYHKDVPWEHQVVTPLPTPTPQRCALRTPSCHTTAHTTTTTTKMCPENTKLSHHCPHPHHKDVPWEHQVVTPLPTPTPQRCALRTPSCHTTAHTTTTTTKMCPENTKLSYHCPHPHHYHKDVPWEHHDGTSLLPTQAGHTHTHTHSSVLHFTLFVNLLPDLLQWSSPDFRSSHHLHVTLEAATWSPDLLHLTFWRHLSSHLLSSHHLSSHLLSCQATSCQATSCQATSCQATSCPATSCPATSCPATSCPATSCPATSCPATSCQATSCQVYWHLSHTTFEADTWSLIALPTRSPVPTWSPDLYFTHLVTTWSLLYPPGHLIFALPTWSPPDLCFTHLVTWSLPYPPGHLSLCTWPFWDTWTSHAIWPV